MGTKRYLPVLILITGLLVLAACGGSATFTDTPEAEEATPASTDTSDYDFSGLPEIPLDTGEPDKLSSDLQLDYTVVLGKDYLQMASGEVVGDSLVLTGGEAVAGEPVVNALAYGMYKLTGLLGKRPLSLNIECLPGGLGEGYFVGVADYTDGKWQWFGPVSFPEYELDLRDVHQQLVTHLGNMYFMIVVPPGSTATHAQSTVIHGTPDPNDLPGFPHHLVATDGQLAEAIGLSWVAGHGTSTYQVFRKALGPEAEWRLVGTTEDTQYLDAPLPDYKLFFYRVRGLNAAGESSWSNIDSGFAGGGDDPCVIRGDVTTIMGEPLPDIFVGLVGFDEEMGRLTSEDGIFRFGDLPPGKYLVAPRHAELEFFPPYTVVDLTGERLAEIHFNAAPTAIFHRVWGFAVTVIELPAGPQVVPLESVMIGAHPITAPENLTFTTTNEDGFYHLEDLAEGIWMVGAGMEGWSFIPPVHEVVINGHNPPDRRDFIGFPDDDPGTED